MMENLNLLTQIEEVGGELGEPDCKLTEPFVVMKMEHSPPGWST